MSVDMVYGDLLTAKEDIIVHQVNCQGVMGSGIAKQVKEKYPKVYETYMDALQCRQSGTYPYISWCTVNDNQTFVNLYAQINYGRDAGVKYTSYDRFCCGLEQIRDKFKDSNHKRTIAFPKNIGCGRGGANWNIIYNMILEILGKDFDIVFYEYKE